MQVQDTENRCFRRTIRAVQSMQVPSNGIHIEVQSDGPPQGPALLLVMGLGMQLTDWPSAMVDRLATSGYRVIRMDNRDAGLSAQMTHLGCPNVWSETLKYKLGWQTRAPYTLSDMARDALGVLDALDCSRAHVIGASMGGMIAQRMALLAPQRLHSLVSLMSSSSARHLPPSSPAVLRAMTGYPRHASHAQIVEHYVHLFGLIGSPGWPMPQQQRREQVMQAVSRGTSREGTLRQTLAVITDDSRADLLSGITTPTLVVHGKNDPLLPYAHGEDTARRIPNARLLGIHGMGHDLPDGLVEMLMPPMLEFLRLHTPND
jgi:pimeloyl-ACP methyl ester carboxylesterase